MRKSEPLGFVGLGAMGAPMVRHLLGLGHRVVVFDVNPRALQAACDAGARVAASPRQLACEVDMVFTCLPSLDALRQVVMGDDGLAAGDAIKVLADFSTTGSEFARELAERLAPRGIAYLDSPITGGVVTAGNGQLGIMCSGPASAFARAEPVMRDLASAIVLYLGAQTGQAQTLKLLNNLLSATGMASTCEAFILGVKAGLDPVVMLEVINAGDASSSASRNKFPKSVLPRRFDYGARMAITAKDTSLTVAEAEARGVPMWIGQAVRQVWQYAVAQGGAERDGSSLITFLEPWAGVEVRARDTPAAPPACAAPGPAPDATVILCETRHEAEIARLFGAWQAQGTCGACRVVGVSPLASLQELLAAMPARAAATRLIVNLCPMATARASELAAALAHAGDGYVEALTIGPMRLTGSADATLVVAGALRDRAHAEALLSRLGGRAIVVSDRPGAGQLMHQIHEAVFATLLAASCEAYVAGAKAGLDPLTTTRIMGVETGRNAASARIIPEQVATRRFDHGRRIGELHRALCFASDAARELGVTPWILDKTRLLYGLAAQSGSPDDDASRLITHYEGWARTEVRVKPSVP